MTNRDKSVRRPTLGKGISSLLGDVGVAEDKRGPKNPDGNLQTVDIELLDPNPEQPRKIFDQEALGQLASSLKQDGFIQPIVVVRGEKSGRFTIVAGERRLRASQLAGIQQVPILIRDKAEQNMLHLALIENIQRANLNVIEEAEAYATLIEDYGLTQELCAERVGKDRSTVANILRMLSLPRDIQDNVMDAQLTMGHARSLLVLENPDEMRRARDIIVKKQLNVRQTEQLCKTFGKPKAPKKEENPDVDYIAESLRTRLQTKVKISGTSQRGRIEISYFSVADLERILGVMGQKF